VGLEVVPALGVDLRDRERVFVVPGIQQTAEQRRAHLPAPEQCDARHRRKANRR
jgi:hypothetical protein